MTETGIFAVFRFNKIIGQAIATCILESLDQLGMDVKNVWGQGYDGA